MAIDRTRDFMSLVTAMSSSGTPARLQPAAPAPAPAHPVPESKGAFTRAVGEVSRGIQSTSAMLRHLTKLVKQRGVLNDPGPEIERVTVCVTESIRSITGQLDALQTFVESKREEAVAAGRVAGDGAAHHSAAEGGEGASNRNRGGVAGGSGRGAGGQAVTEPLVVVDPLETVQGLTHSDVVLSQMKGQVYGFTSSLKHILQVRTESLKAQAARRRHFGGAKDLGRSLGLDQQHQGGGSGGSGGGGAPAGAAAAPVPSAARSAHAKPSWAGAATPSALGASSSGGGGGGAFGALTAGSLSSALHGSGDAVISIGAPASSAAMFAPVSAAQLQSLAEPDGEAAVLAARASDVAVLERQIGELSGLFSRLASMIAEQGSMVDRLEDDTETALSRLEAGTGQLERYRAKVTNNKTLALKVASIIIAFLVFFVLFGV